jgi:hypothetical protein
LLARRVPLAVLALGAALYVGALVYPPFDRRYPRPDTLVYAIDADHDRAFWLSPDPAPDAWTSAALAGARAQAAPAPFWFYDTAPLLVADAPPSREPAPEIQWIDDTHARITSPANTELLAVRVEGAASIEVAHTPVGDAFRWFAPPAAGVEIAITPLPRARVTIRAVIQRAGLPASVGPRPPALMAKPGKMPPWDDLLESDTTIVARVVTR